MNQSINKIKQTIIFCSLFINLSLFIILFTPISEILHKMLMTSDLPKKSEVIVILSSTFPFETKKGVPCLSTLMRLEKGLELYRQGYANKIIVFGGIWIKNANKTTAQAMKDRLLLYGVPEQDVIVHDTLRGHALYYDNLMLLLKDYGNQFDFNNAIFVTSAEHSFRMKKCLMKKLKNSLVVTSEPYELSPDWGTRFNLFRRVANELLFAIPEFYLKGRF